MAVLLSALVVCGATAANVNRNLSKEAKACQTVWDEKNGIGEQLAVRAKNATLLYSVTNGYASLGAENAALRAAYNALYDAQTPSEKCAANDALTAAADALWSAFGKAGAAAEDQETAGVYYNLVLNAGRVITLSGYNAAVDGYDALTAAFPLDLLAPVIFVDAPEAFRCS